MVDSTAHFGCGLSLYDSYMDSVILLCSRRDERGERFVKWPVDADLDFGDVTPMMYLHHFDQVQPSRERLTLIMMRWYGALLYGLNEAHCSFRNLGYALCILLAKFLVNMSDE